RPSPPSAVPAQHRGGSYRATPAKSYQRHRMIAPSREPCVRCARGVPRYPGLASKLIKVRGIVTRIAAAARLRGTKAHCRLAQGKGCFRQGGKEPKQACGRRVGQICILEFI